MSRRSRRTAGLAVLLGLSAVLPPVQARAKAVAVLAEAFGFPFPRPVAPEISRAERRFDGVVGDLYTPSGRAPGIVLVPGAAPAGRRDPRVVRLARALAKSGRSVFVPELELFERRFDRDDVDAISSAIEQVARLTNAPVSVLGFSYGGSYSLIAAADPATQAHVRQIALFGAYFDLVGYLQAAATGTSLVEGEMIAWDADPRAEQALRRYGAELAPPEARDALKQALATDIDPDALPPDARALYEFLTHDEPERTYDLAADLPPHARRFLERFSPSSVADRLEVPIIVLHSRDDPVVPYGESLRLVNALPQARLFTVELFRHVDREQASWVEALPDAITAWRFASALLSAQEDVL